MIGPGAEVLVADACSLPFVDGSFDAVFAHHVAGHLLGEERGSMAREAARVLRAGGTLHFREFGEEDMRFGKGEEVEPGTFRRGSGVVTHYFSEEEVRELFEGLCPDLVCTERWDVRIRGRECRRAEVVGVLKRRQTR